MVSSCDQLVRVWIDCKLQFREFIVVDASSSPTVGELRRAVGEKLTVESEKYDLLIEIGLSNGDKSTRKMDDHENILQVFQKHKRYSIRVVWALKTEKEINDDIDKCRPAPSRWSKVFQSMDERLTSILDGYQNLPSHWLELFRLLDESLWAVGENPLTQAEVKYIITKCAPILLSLPSDPNIDSLHDANAHARRPKSLDLYGNYYTKQKCYQDKVSPKQTSDIPDIDNPELIPYLQPTTTSPRNTPYDLALQQLLYPQNYPPLSSSSPLSLPSMQRRTTVDSYPTKSRLQEIVNLTLDISSSPPPIPISPSDSPVPMDVDYINTSRNNSFSHISYTPTSSSPIPLSPLTPSPMTPSTPNHLSSPLYKRYSQDASSSIPDAATKREWRHAQSHFQQLQFSSKPDTNKVIHILAQTLLEKRLQVVPNT